jgi:hypothetical protein
VYTALHRSKAKDRWYTRECENATISAANATALLDVVLMQKSRFWLLTKWLAEGKIECSEGLAVVVARHDADLAGMVRSQAATTAAVATAATARSTPPPPVLPPPPPPRNTTNGTLNLPPPRGIGSTSNGSSSLNMPPPRNNVDLPPLQTNHKRKDRSAPAAVTRSPVTPPIDSEPMNWDDVGIVRRSSASSSSTRSEVALTSVPGSASAETFRRKCTEAPTNNDDDTEESPPKRARVDDATVLKSMSVRNLKAEAAHFNVDLSGCCEKSDIGAQLQEAAGDPALSVPAANQF